MKVNELAPKTKVSKKKRKLITQLDTPLLKRIIPEKNANKKTRKDSDRSFTESLNEIEMDSTESSEERDNTPKSLKKKSKKKNNKKKTSSDIGRAELNRKCVEYLINWKHDRSNWKFAKTKQMRLISNMFDVEKLPEESFAIFMDYMSGASAAMKKMIVEKANELIAAREKWETLKEEEKLTNPEVDIGKYERARNIVQCVE